MALGALVMLQLACRGAPGPGPWQDEGGWRWRELAPAGRGGIGFTSLGGRPSGIRFANRVSDSSALRNRHLVHGSGVAIADVDGDGLPDIFFAAIEGPNHLYRNLGGWRFEDVTEAAGVALAGLPSSGAVFADVDGDGDMDLIVTAMGGQNRLLLNDGHGRFTDVTATSGFVAQDRGSTTAVLADVDGDGDLDLYVANYKARTMLDSLSPQARAFDRIVTRRGDAYEVVPELREHYRVIPRDDIRAVSLVQRAESDWFYLNDGTGRFVREPLANNPRFRDPAGRLLDREPDDFGLAARFFDANGDGAPDLYVANDFEDPDHFWLNDGRGNFRLVGPEAVRQTSNSGMAVDVSDVNRDGLVDLFEVDMLANDSRRLKTQLPTHTAIPKMPGDYARQAQWQRNVLLHNRGDGTFAEIAAQAGVEASGWSWSAVFVDVDLDGYEDLLIGTGHTWDLMDGDAIERLRSTASGLDWRDMRKLYPRLSLPNVAFRNRGDLTFEDVSAAWRFGVDADISHGIAVGDLDGDGDLDVVVNRLNAEALVLRNDAAAPRIAVRLAGRPPNTTGVGARIVVRGGPVPAQSKEVSLGGLYLSSSEPTYSFSAGAADALEIEVVWRDGGRTVVPGARPGRLYEIREPRQAVAPPARSMLPDPGAPLWFEDQSAAVSHWHRDPRFNDFARQPLLPWKLSQSGPGVGWVDLDQDGHEDVVIGGGAGQPLGVFRNAGGGRFVSIPIRGARDSLDLTAVAAWVEGGHARLLVGQSSYESRSPAAALAAPAVFGVRPEQGGLALETLIAGDTSSAGPIALADLDGDGQLDLLVGGRVAPGAYPVPATSRLFRRQGDSYLSDETNAAVLRGVGLVSAALFTDLDADGDPDLVLATEWGPIRILINDGGRFTDRTAALGFDQWRGLWNGVATGDFDGDGRIDLVATNWGRNTTWSADRDSPLWLYFGAFNDDGAVHSLLARYDPRIGAVAPLYGLNRLAAAVPTVRARTPTFAAYADASVDQVLGRQARVARVGVTTLDHMVFLNRGDRFEGMPLPTQAQFAPAFGVVVADLDGDGVQDLTLAQNFSATDLMTPRFDAGQGLVLRGDGRGGFAEVPGRISGIRMIEDQRGLAAADFDGDGRVDLLVGRNAAPVALFRNRIAVPGIRIRPGEGAVGAQIRLETEAGLGPMIEIRAGGGYWSQDGAPVLTGPGAARAVVVRWPGGEDGRLPLAAGQREVRLERPTGPRGSR